jgi:hypothetical protein
MMAFQSTVPVRSASLEAKVTRGHTGQVIDYGIVSYFHQDKVCHWLAQVEIWCRRKRIDRELALQGDRT